MKRLGRMMILGLVLVFLLPLFGALAEIGVLQQKSENGDTLYRITQFEGELPEALQKPLMEGGFDGAVCICGAMLEKQPTEQQLEAIKKLPGDKAARMTNLENARALVALEMAGERQLLGLSRESDGKWTVEAFGTKALLPGRDFTITVKDVGNEARMFPMTRFCVEYEMPDGGTESYGLMSEIWDEGVAPWFVSTYEKKDASGRDTFIVERTYLRGFRVYTLPFAGDGPGGVDYPAYVNTFLAYMGSIGEIPTSEEQVKKTAEESWKRFEGTDLAMTASVNLREKPTTSSRSLGVLNVGTLVHVLEQKAGKDYPWYHVRLGREEGWVAGNYLKFPKDDHFDSYLSLPLPVARTLGGVALRGKPADTAEVVMELPQGTLMHVLAEVEGSWLYVLAPKGELTWEMDVDGASGYVRVDAVKQAVSVDVVAP